MPRRHSAAIWGVVAAVAVLVTRVHEVFGSAVALLRPTLTVPVLAAAFCLYRVGLPGRRTFRSFPILGIYLALASLAFVGIPFALWPGGAFEFAKGNLLIVVLLVLVLSTVGDQSDDYDIVIRSYCLLSFIVFATNLLRASALRNPEGRLAGLGIYDPNDLAAFAALTAPLALSLIFARAWLWRLLGLATAGSATIIVIETGSRGGILALLAGILVTLAGFPTRRMFVTLAVAFGLSSAAISMADRSLLDRLASVTQISEDYNTRSRTGRVEIWRRGVSYLVDRPLTGVGIVNFSVAEGRRNSSDGVVSAWLNAHNIFVQIGAELGVPGLLLLAILLLRSFSSAFAVWALGGKQSSRPEALGALVALFTAGMFLSLAYSAMLAFVTSIAFIANRSTSKRHFFARERNVI